MVAVTISPTYEIVKKIKVKKQVRFNVQVSEKENDRMEAGPALADKLRLAASKGLQDRVQELLKTGAPLDPDREGRTPLHYAASGGHLDVCRLLLRGGCHPSAMDNMGYTSLHCAANQGHHQVAALLIEAGCHLDVQDEMHGNTALHEAAWNGFSEMVSLLIRYKCNVFVTNKSGFTALHLAAQNGHNQSARILLYGISNPDARNNYGDTPLHTACRYGHAGVTRILISARCRINEQNKNGDTGLHIAAALRRRKIAKLLCEAGIDVNIRNKQNETASDVSRRKDHLDIIDVINAPRTAQRGSSRSTSQGRRSNQSSSRSKDDTLSLSEHEDSSKAKEETKKSVFSFFRKKKKDKDKDKEKSKDKNTKTKSVEPRPRKPSAPPPTQAMPAHPFTPTVGLINQYVPRPGVQYYRDLAGNVKQGPVGYAPVCQCQPTLRRMQAHVEHDRYHIWEQMNVTREQIQDRMHWLDQRQADQAAMIQDRLDLEELACFGRIDNRTRQERMHTRQIVQEHDHRVRNELKDWTVNRMQSLERRVNGLDRHHDDADWNSRPHRSKLMENDLNGFVEGRLFRSRSDETLSVSEYSTKQKVERDMAHQVALRELRDLKQNSQNTRRRRERVPVRSRDESRDRVTQSRDKLAQSRDALPQSRDALAQSRDKLNQSRDSSVQSHESREGRDRPDGTERKRFTPEGHRPRSFHEHGQANRGDLSRDYRADLAGDYRRAQSEDELSPRKEKQNTEWTYPSKPVQNPPNKSLQDRRYSEPAYAVPYHRAESGSNPDSGYSSRIYHTLLQQRQDTSPQPSSTSTGHNISNITTSSSMSRTDSTSHSSPGKTQVVPLPGNPQPGKPGYYNNYVHRVSQQVEQYYLRHNAPPRYNNIVNNNNNLPVKKTDDRIVATDV